jgi:hypothetical protein
LKRLLQYLALLGLVVFREQDDSWFDEFAGHVSSCHHETDGQHLVLTTVTRAARKNRLPPAPSRN